MVGYGIPIGEETIQGYLWRVKWVDCIDIALVGAGCCEFQGDRNLIIWDLRSGYKLHHVIPAVLKCVESIYGSIDSYLEILKKHPIDPDNWKNPNLFMNMGWGEFLPKGPEFKDPIDFPPTGFKMKDVS